MDRIRNTSQKSRLANYHPLWKWSICLAGHYVYHLFSPVAPVECCVASLVFVVVHTAVSDRPFGHLVSMLSVVSPGIERRVVVGVEGDVACEIKEIGYLTSREWDSLTFSFRRWRIVVRKVPVMPVNLTLQPFKNVLNLCFLNKMHFLLSNTHFPTAIASTTTRITKSSMMTINVPVRA